MKSDMNFEKAMNRLAEINTILEKGDISLDDSLNLYAEGTKLSSFCYKELDKAKQKIELIEESVEG